MRQRLILVVIFAILTGCEALVTSPPPEGDDFETPFEGLSPALNAMFLAGDENFERQFGAADGLGPRFNNDACASCHPADGGGTPETLLVRFSYGDDPAIERGGPQLQDRSVPGVAPEKLPDDADWSPRKPPPVFGVGLIEAIDEAEILANSDPDDEDGDGISGRPNWVSAAEFVPPTEIGGGDGMQLGRFGLKANVSSLLEQVVLAYQQDMGVTSDFAPDENHAAATDGFPDLASDPEVPARTVLDTVFYVRLLRPPKRGPSTDLTQRGETLFEDVGCADCHIPSLRTGERAIPQLSEQDVRLYSDLLLHDMGEELADDRPDGSATGREWRTTPLWGTRLAGEFNGGTFYLHDGRARTLQQAIDLHGGEAREARDAFFELSSSDREALLGFVRSL